MQALKNDIVRAAVLWERAKHEKVGSYDPNRNLAAEETRLGKAVQDYLQYLLKKDAPATMDFEGEPKK